MLAGAVHPSIMQAGEKFLTEPLQSNLGKLGNPFKPKFGRCLGVAGVALPRQSTLVGHMGHNVSFK